jgi:hypothetical protein
MLRFSPSVGRKEAHHRVYELVAKCRKECLTLIDGFQRWEPELKRLLEADGTFPLSPDTYLGEAPAVCSAVIDECDRHIQESKSTANVGPSTTFYAPPNKPGL